MIGDHREPIYVQAMQQKVDIVSDTITFIGKVMIRRGSINIYADKVIIFHFKNERYQIIIGYGDLISFRQLQDDGRLIQGYSKKIRYEVANGLVILKDNAYLKHLGNSIRSDYIAYLIKEQRAEAFGNKDKQVTVVLMPKKTPSNYHRKKIN
ncbi:lipopolysaccharide transport periplasmic protein LptA [Sodalis sp. CWE]|uniref:lipopolysaccharide transport periplasmic protein LptA n=1 Tax=Sodalis sp. CWE TaxID=2803816 RepID=UPI001C7DC845|nr:lipopolysaccharide transport periplasmic protein LptA [Sodalis sp. CWE]MBX4180847.1 lipopolysaccharide transport periplasmic protein LptA [Sodalis sp. CWE]